jgi:hypothetical protein
MVKLKDTMRRATEMLPYRVPRLSCSLAGLVIASSGGGLSGDRHIVGLCLCCWLADTGSVC